MYNFKYYMFISIKAAAGALLREYHNYYKLNVSHINKNSRYLGIHIYKNEEYEFIELKYYMYLKNDTRYYYTFTKEFRDDESNPYSKFVLYINKDNICESNFPNSVVDIIKKYGGILSIDKMFNDI